MSATLFREVVLPERDAAATWDVLVEDHQIAEVAHAGQVRVPEAAEVVDGRGRWLLPGFLDDHVHLREPGLAHKEGYASGTRAAAAGGITTLLEIQNNPPLMTARAAVEDKLALVRPQSVVNVGVYGSLSMRVGADGVSAELPEVSEMSDLVAGYKLFMGCSTGGLEIESEELQVALFQAVAATGHWLFVHAEDQARLREGLAKYSADGAKSWHLARSAAAEIEACEIALRLGRETGARVHLFHLSSAGGTDALAQARADGQPATGGTCPHYLYFTHEDTARLGSLLRVNPSIKTADDRDRLIEGLRTGDIDCLSTDHAPHTLEEKQRPFAEAPSGIPALDIFMPLCLTLAQRGLLPLTTVIERAARTPAQLHGFLRKGRIDEGYDADLVLVDHDTPRPVRGADHFSKARHTPYEGMELYGWPLRTMVMRQTVYTRPAGR